MTLVNFAIKSSIRLWQGYMSTEDKVQGRKRRPKTKHAQLYSLLSAQIPQHSDQERFRRSAREQWPERNAVCFRSLDDIQSVSLKIASKAGTGLVVDQVDLIAGGY